MSALEDLTPDELLIMSIFEIKRFVTSREISKIPGRAPGVDGGLSYSRVSRLLRRSLIKKTGQIGHYAICSKKEA